jgi:phosphonate transport system substrate-binding protein
MMLRLITLLGFSVVLLTSTMVYGAGERPIRFGSVAEDIPAAMHQRLTPLMDYLEKAVGRQVVLMLSPNMARAIKDLSKGKVELAYLTPVAYIRAHEQGGATLIAKVISNKQAYFRLVLVVRDDSPIKDVKDLAGKSFAFGDPAALLQRAVVETSGTSLANLGSVNYLGHYDNIIRGVLNRDYDAGIIPESKARKWAKYGLRVIYSSPQLPPYNIAATKKLDRATFLKLQKALLGLDERNPDHQRVLQAMGDDYNGFTRTNDQEYDIVRKLIKPYRQ